MSVSISQLPAIPAGSQFRVQKIEDVVTPHPFMITEKHVAYASDHTSGMLTEQSIRDSHAKCGMRGCNLSYDQHEHLHNTVFVEVPQNSDLNAIPGLHDWLLSAKQKAEAEHLEISGFAFPRGKF